MYSPLSDILRGLNYSEGSKDSILPFLFYASLSAFPINLQYTELLHACSYCGMIRMTLEDCTGACSYLGIIWWRNMYFPVNMQSQLCGVA